MTTANTARPWIKYDGHVTSASGTLFSFFSLLFPLQLPSLALPMQIPDIRQLSPLVDCEVNTRSQLPDFTVPHQDSATGMATPEILSLIGAE